MRSFPVRVRVWLQVPSFSAAPDPRPGSAP